MKIKFLKEASLERLKQNINENIDHYKKMNMTWIKKEDLIEFKKEFPDFQLDVSGVNPEKTDFENIKIIYSNMRALTESQASVEKLWAGLCHDKFWSYMQYRWPLKKANKGEEDYIKNHYFFKQSNTRALMTNALARLWWVGYMTYDAGAKDPFILTEYICKDLNGRGFPLLTGSNFANNKEILKSLLYTLMDFEKSKKLSREEFNEVTKMMNLWGGKILLDSLSREELHTKITSYLKNRKRAKSNK